MKDEKISDNDQLNNIQIVMTDECGDTMWDEVLAQDFFTKKASLSNEEIIQQPETEKIYNGKELR